MGVVPYLEAFILREISTQFTEWVKKFIHEQLDAASHKKLSYSVEDFEEWSYNANPDVNEEIYFAIFLACLLSGRGFVHFSIAVRPETFLMALEMARGKRYSLAVPYLAWAIDLEGNSMRHMDES